MVVKIIGKKSRTCKVGWVLFHKLAIFKGIFGWIKLDDFEFLSLWGNNTSDCNTFVFPGKTLRLILIEVDGTGLVTKSKGNNFILKF